MDQMHGERGQAAPRAVTVQRHDQPQRQSRASLRMCTCSHGGRGFVHFKACCPVQCASRVRRWVRHHVKPCPRHDNGGGHQTAAWCVHSDAGLNPTRHAAHVVPYAHHDAGSQNEEERERADRGSSPAAWPSCQPTRSMWTWACMRANLADSGGGSTVEGQSSPLSVA